MKKVVFFATSMLFLFESYALAQQQKVKPTEEFRAYILNKRPLRSIKFGNSQEIASRKQELKFESTSKMVLNLLPYLNTPSSVTKIADNLKAKGIDPASQVAVEVLEYPDRLIVKQSLQYKGNARVCSERGDELSKQGIPCYKKKMDATRLDADSQKKMKARISETRSKINRLRTSPIAGYSLDELKAMNDEQLLLAALNGGTFTSESYLMVPKVVWKNAAKLPMKNRNAANSDFTSANLDFTKTQDVVSKPKIEIDPRIFTVAPQERLPDINFTLQKFQDHNTRYLVDGFTWGSEYSWSQRFGDCVDLWLTEPCAFIEPKATIGYGLGVRIPLQMDIDTERGVITPGNTLKSASATINLTPVDGDNNIYSAAGMPNDKLFGGKEIVAGAYVTAGFDYMLGYSWEHVEAVSLGKDLTDYMPSKGNIRPPAPGERVQLADVWSDDMAAGMLNYGVVGVTFHAGLKFDLVGKAIQAKTMVFSFPPDTGVRLVESFPFARGNFFVAGPSAATTVFDPVYTAALSVVPGLKINPFLDVAIYSASWPITLWLNDFSNLAIESPEFSFGVHEGTTRGYRINATASQLAVSPY